MEDGLTKQIEKSTDENLIATRIAIDTVLVEFDIPVTLDIRSEIIMAVFKLVQKKFLTSSNSKFEKDKMSEILWIAKSYIISNIYLKIFGKSKTISYLCYNVPTSR